MGYTSLEEKFRAFGWGTRIVNGHDISEMIDTLQAFPFEANRPSVIIARTRAGAGVQFMQDQVLWHYRVPSDQDLKQVLIELGEQPIHMG
jgi:transketolase